jgi:hypothetical protein
VRNAYSNLIEKHEGKRPLRILVNRRIILKWILKK